MPPPRALSPANAAPRALSARSVLALATASAALGLAEAGAVRLASLYLYHELAYAVVGAGLFALAMGALTAGRGPPFASQTTPLSGPLLLAATTALSAAWLLPRSNLAWALGLAIWPFAAHGAASGRAFLACASPAARGKLYAAELIGACVGLVVLAPALVAWGGGAGILGAAAALFAVAAAIAAQGRRHRWLAGVLAFAALAVWPMLEAKLPSPVGVARHLDAAVARDGARALFSDEAIWARTDLVVPLADDAPALLYTDGLHVARAVPWDGENPAFQRPSLERMAALRRAALAPCAGGDVLVLAAGGGFEVIVALQAGAVHVDAVEVNGAMPRLLRAHAPHHASVLDDPRVSWHTAEGRHFVEQARAALRSSDGVAAHKRWRCVLLGLVETEPASLRGRAHIDGRLLTVEALQSLRDVLEPGGVVAVIHNEDSLGAASHAALNAVFGADATVAFALDDSAAINAARVLVAATTSAAHRAAIAASARAAGGHDGPAASLAAPPSDDRPYLLVRSMTDGLRVDVVLGLVLVVMGLLAVFRQSRLRRGQPHHELHALGRRGRVAATLSPLLAGFGGALVQMVVAAQIAGLIGAPALAITVAVAACLLGAAAGAALVRRLPGDVFAIGSGVMTALLLGVAAGPLVSAGAGVSLPLALALGAFAAAVAAVAAAPAFLRALDAQPHGRHVALALDGLGALLGATAMAALAPMWGLSALGFIAGGALAVASWLGSLVGVRSSLLLISQKWVKEKI